MKQRACGVGSRHRRAITCPGPGIRGTAYGRQGRPSYARTTPEIKVRAVKRRGAKGSAAWRRLR